MRNLEDTTFVAALEDNIRQQGAMDKLASDRHKTLISHKAHDVLRAYYIDDWQSELWHQHQNFAGNYIGTIKAKTNCTLNATGAPASTWLLCIMWVVMVLNVLANAQLQWNMPHEALTGSTPDISAFLEFGFWDLVYYRVNEHGFPSDSDE